MYRILVKKYAGSIPVLEEGFIVDEEKKKQELLFEKIPCKVQVALEKEGEALKFWIRAEALQKLDAPVSLSLELMEDKWNRSDYVFMPAAVYNGNRQECQKLPYPPYYGSKLKDGWHQVITDIPHLSKDKNPSNIQLLAGDMSTPSMGCFKKEKQEGMLMLAPHKSGGKYHGFTVQEEGKCVTFRISSPGIREDKKYYFGELLDGSGFYPTCDFVSDDEGVILDAGETLELTAKVLKFPAHDLYEYFSKFNMVRETLEHGEMFHSIPFSAAYEAVREKYIQMNFHEEGYFRVGTENTVPPSFWQAGWVGGGMNTYPFLLTDQGDAYTKSLSTLEFIIHHLQLENGWYIPMYAEGTAYGDNFSDIGEPILLVRKAADLLYFMCKQAFYLKKYDKLPEGMECSIKLQADAFVRFVRKNGQLGQFINMWLETQEIGDTASAAIAPAALALAYEYFGKTEYLETAERLASLYWEDYLKEGILNGGPGEICQAPDSESAFGYLESCVQLYETTGNGRWLKAAKEAFELAITWVVSYDFDFPANSTAAKMGAHTRGTVFANAQNKHSAPGICTLSGNSMLKLYRFTGDEKYLEWMGRISHALSQFVSLEDRPIETLSGKPLLAGYFNERVQMSDWEGKHTVGEFLYGSNWPEVSMLLTYVEIPGIYVDVKNNLIKCSDHVVAELVKEKENQRYIKIINPTSYDATVTLMIDGNRHKQIGHLYYNDMEKIMVKSGEEKSVRISALI